MHKGIIMEDEYEDDNMWDDDQESPGYDQEAENQAIQQECTKTFASRDYIMEPGVFNHLKRYFQAGGAPEQVVQLLSENYTAVAQLVNLLAEWLILAGVSINEVQQMVEDHLKAMILKYFDPKKADSIFTDEGETPAWLTAMIEHPSWRSLIYKLAEDYPDCLMLNFTIKLISDAGFQGEITSISTAAQQIEVFSRVLRTSIASFLEGGEESLEKNLPEFVKMVCHGEHTYLYSQALLKLLSQETKGGANIRRLAQEVHKCARIKGHEVTPITMALSGATAYPRACQALASMLGRNALNPADINVLYKVYTTNDSPPVDLIRVPHFLELFINALFKPGSNINQEHKTKYFYILAYACSVYETNKKGGKRVVNKDELKPTTQALEKAHTICRESKGASELIVEVNTLHQCIRFPVVALGVLRWVDYTVSEKSYFKLNTDHTPLHLALLDEISSCHVQLHSKILDLLVRLFKSPFEELDVLVQLELKKTLLDRMVHLLSRGYVVPVVSYIRKCWEKQDTDISLIRHFVTEVLDIIAPPYTSEFVQLFLPLVENEDITGPLKNENDSDPVADFIVHCKSNYIVVG